MAAGFAPDLSSAEMGMRLDMGLHARGWLSAESGRGDHGASRSRPAALSSTTAWSSGRCACRCIQDSPRRQTKYLLKKALCRYLPAEFVYRPKRGFGVPVAQWLRGPLRSWAGN